MSDVATALEAVEKILNAHSESVRDTHGVWRCGICHEEDPCQTWRDTSTLFLIIERMGASAQRTCPPGIGPGMPDHAWGDADTCSVCGAKRGVDAA